MTKLSDSMVKIACLQEVFSEMSEMEASPVVSRTITVMKRYEEI